MEIKKILTDFIKWQSDESRLHNELLSPESIAEEFMSVYLKRKKHVAIISFDSEDFIEWSERKFEKFKPLMRKKFTIGDTTYYCVSRCLDIKGCQFDEVMKTDKAWKHKEYHEIINEIQLCLNTTAKIK